MEIYKKRISLLFILFLSFMIFSINIINADTWEDTCESDEDCTEYIDENTGNPIDTCKDNTKWFCAVDWGTSECDHPIKNCRLKCLEGCCWVADGSTNCDSGYSYCYCPDGPPPEDDVGCENIPKDHVPESCPKCKNCEDCIYHWWTPGGNSCGWCGDDNTCKYGSLSGPEEGECNDWYWVNCEGAAEPQECSQGSQESTDWDWTPDGCITSQWNCENCGTADECCEIWGDPGCESGLYVKGTKGYIYVVDPSISQVACEEYEPPNEARIEISLDPEQECYEPGDEMNYITLKFYLNDVLTDPSEKTLKIKYHEEDLINDYTDQLSKNKIGEYKFTWDLTIEEEDATGLRKITATATFPGGETTEATKEYEIQETCDGSSDDAIPITDCQEITEPGNYVLANDITMTGQNKVSYDKSSGGTYYACIVISTSNVNIEGNGKSIEGYREYLGIAILGDNNKIENLKLKNFWTGIRIYSGKNDNTITDTVITNMDEDGIFVDSNSNIIKNNIFENNGRNGVFITTITTDTEDNTIEGNVIKKSGVNGIVIFGGTHKINGNTVCENTNNDIMLSARSTTSELSNNVCNILSYPLGPGRCGRLCPGTSTQYSTETPEAGESLQLSFYGQDIYQGGLAIITDHFNDQSSNESNTAQR